MDHDLMDYEVSGQELVVECSCGVKAAGSWEVEYGEHGTRLSPGYDACLVVTMEETDCPLASDEEELADLVGAELAR